MVAAFGLRMCMAQNLHRRQVRAGRPRGKEGEIFWGVCVCVCVCMCMLCVVCVVCGVCVLCVVYVYMGGIVCGMYVVL